jgi:biotin transport system substrate-specific component
MQSKTRNMILVSLFAALTAVGGFLEIPVPPVPFTLQTFFVKLAGLLLGGKLALASQGIYIAMGLLGVPVFTQGGGIQYIFNPTFGYILSFAVSAYVMGKMTEKLDAKEKSFYKYFVISFIGSMINYAIGVPYLYIILKYVNHLPTTLSGVLMTGCIIFLPWDMVKIAVSAWIAKRIHGIKNLSLKNDI